ncbi:hypothetical protein BK816_07905 [Boudabousia tangfeifanii]|uniref:Fe/B12 periplasmic-binding domain-containing protein n=1 Tax=Boudabousia tangfeifanii TaxID=1912795 RepID=A0A1D9MML1_9ACTO|nr:hypothetical protein BK816_07905 [Boudabousia tangfeifanii]
MKHAQGETEVPCNPKNVAVMDLAAADDMVSLGAGDSIGILPKAPGLPAVLKPYEGKAKAGSMVKPDLEAIAGAKPDLIILSSRTAKVYNDLKDVAPTIDLSDAKGVSTMQANDDKIRTIAQIFGQKEQGERAISELHARAGEIAAKAQGGKSLFIMTNGGKMSAFGPNSRFAIVFQDLGFAPAADVKQEGRHGEPISFEFVSQANPRYLFVLDRDSAVGHGENAAQALLDNDLIKNTEAGKNNGIDYLNGTDWYLVGGGIATMNGMLDQVASVLK